MPPTRSARRATSASATSTSPTWSSAAAKAADRQRSERAGSADLRQRGLDSEAVDEVVHRIVTVPLHPPERHVAPLEHERDQRLPELTVGHGLALAVHPSSAAPSDVPLVAEAVHDVGRVADHFERS